MTDILWVKRQCPSCGVAALAWEDIPWTGGLQLRCLECGHVSKVVR